MRLLNSQEPHVPEAEPARREYDDLASVYDRRWHRYVDATLRSVLQSVRFQGHERVLDVACGTGELERLLLARWPDLPIVGVDISQGMLRQAASKLPAVSWVQADVTHLPLPSEYFDCVICASSFHYFHSPVQALHEIHRVLRPGGSFIQVDWCDDYLSCKLCSLWLRLTEPAFFKTYSIRDCRSLLQDAGFDVLHADHFRVRWLWGLMRFVSRRKARNPS